MNEELLTRLINALESIDSSLTEVAASLDSLDQNLTQCISSAQEGNRFCIAGDVTSYISN